MAIQNRRGAYEDFDPDKLLPGEWATVLEGDPNAGDGKSTYLSYGNGDVKRMATYEDMDNNIKQSVTVIADNAANQAVAGAGGRIDNAINLANTATKNTNQIATTVENKLEAGEFIGPVGPQGIPGVSPTLSITDIAGGHKVTITDAGGGKNFDVMDGKATIVDSSLSQASINPVQNKVVAGALNGKQNNLGFTPLQQGGGSGQLSNKVYIGWSGSKLKAQVDNVDQGDIAFEGWANGQLAGKSNTGHAHERLTNSVGGEVVLLKSGDNYFLRAAEATYETVLGGSSARYNTVYLKTSPNVSSDINLKRDIVKIADDDRYLALFDEIEPYSFGFKSGDRIHTGFISQYVEEALEKVGLTADECAFFCKDLFVEEVLDGDGNRTYDDNNELITRQIYNDDGTPKYMYSLRLEEYIGIMTAKIKQVEARNAELGSVCQSLEKRIMALEAMVGKG